MPLNFYRFFNILGDVRILKKWTACFLGAAWQFFTHFLNQKMWSSLIELIHSVFEWARDPKFQRSESNRKRSIKSCNRLTCFSGTVRRRLTPSSKCKYRAILLTLASDTTIHYLRRRYVDTWVRNSRDRVPATKEISYLSVQNRRLLGPLKAKF